jgi:raffinose/stachyose/melibiose transport system permease protein
MKRKSPGERSAEARILSGGTKAAIYLVLAICTVVVLVPLLWLLSTSLKSQEEMTRNIWGLPKVFFWDNYISTWKNGNMPVYLINSIRVALVSVTATLVTTSTLAFVLSRFKFKLRKALYYIIIIGMMIPIHSVVIPIYISTRDWGLHNNLYLLGLVYTAFQIPFSVFILSGFMAGIPKELEEAAIIDGAGVFGVFWRIIIPLSKEGLVTISVLALMAAWNELLLAMLMINTVKLKTLPAGLMGFITEYSSKYPQLCAGLLLACLPNIIFYALAQETIIKGMTLGAIKG